MASASSSPPSPNRRSGLGSSVDLGKRHGIPATDWTQEHETELTELKAKLRAAHKSWSAEQELYHERVRISCDMMLCRPGFDLRGQHDHLEELKRKFKKREQKAEKRAIKLARKESDEGKEVRSFVLCD